jgi:type II secretory pathway pseudopilin PulG
LESVACRCRRGISLLEMLVSGLLLGIMTAMAVPTIAWVTHQQLAIAQHQTAQAEVVNIMERVSVWPWERLNDPQAVAEVTLTPEIQSQLAGARLRIAVETPEGHPDARRIRVILNWNDRSGRPTAEAALAAWVYRQGGSA